MNGSKPPRRRRLAVVLGALFALALLMGPGPGLYLVNPDPGDPAATFTVLGMPVLYAWCVFWALVQAVVVLLAYRLLWKEEP